ncbi:uncharacterized protein N7484_006343 [Penicillium longicatenatum]|uniref:uncharacterized protein n=1 Tax=Penicillium longicatenatum TaxID=1561947 RepID=UPI0025478891|nr:uncharacterized protein N7484_006343 [Penicillium longicatenatum]KAJ5643836.1 hypothetical protein N7484_006343 [Penicillium longicatenatum]
MTSKLATKSPPAYTAHEIPLHEVPLAPITPDTNTHHKTSRLDIKIILSAMLMMLLALVPIAGGGYVLYLTIELGGSPDFHDPDDWFYVVLWGFTSLLFIGIGVYMIGAALFCLIAGEGTIDRCSGKGSRRNQPV